MNEALIKAAVRACITLSSAIEATLEGQGSAQEIVHEVRSDLVEAYNLLTNQLAIDLNLDARKLVRDVIAADLESARAVLRAQGVL